MREISPSKNLSSGQFLAIMPLVRDQVESIRRQKAAKKRARPSAALVDKSTLLMSELRAALIDKTAALVDENLTGRSDMCIQFAQLLNLALRHLGLPSRVAVGVARYYDEKRRVIFEWDHAWVRVGDEVIDGNVDSLDENIMVPDEVRVRPYWGPITDTPSDRYLNEHKSETLPDDDDVTTVWWHDLQNWLDQEPST